MANLNTEIPTLTLKDGTTIPMLGYGTGTAMFKSGSDTKIDRERVDQIKTAIKLGYTHLDGAEMYNTEPELGTAIKESKVEREKLFITTKTTSVEDITKALDTSLKKLKLDYVDLYLLHIPWVEDKRPLTECWKEMEALKAAGKARSIGVSNFLIPHIEKIMEVATTPPAINQVEYNIYLQRRELYDYHQKHGIALAAYGPNIPCTKAAGGPADGMIAALKKKYAVNETEICMRWVIEKGVPVVTTSSKEQRLSDYMRIAAFKLTPREVNDLAEIGFEKHYRAFWTKKFDPEDRS